MAYYGVREGKLPGVYETWKECEEQIKGYSGAVYKKFKTREEALEFVNKGNKVTSYSLEDLDDTDLIRDLKKEKNILERIDRLEERLALLEERVGGLEPLPSREKSVAEERVEETIEAPRELGKDEMIAYVDGSYKKSTEEYSYGMLIFTSEGESSYCEKYSDDLRSMRNVAGEIRGAEKAMKKALELGKKKLYLYYDYLGIEKWAKEEWKANKKGTQDYRDYYKSIKDKLDVEFVKVQAHSGDRYNDRADELAKEALGID